MEKIECGDSPTNPKAHVIHGEADLVERWDHVTEHHPWWMRECLGKSDAQIRRELTRWFREVPR